MKKIAISVVGLFLAIGSESQSYGSSGLTSENKTMSGFLDEKEGDCFAWRFYLLTEIYGTVHQGAVRNVNDMRRKYFHHSTHYDLGAPPIDMYKVLPPKTAKEIIDTIIEKEGGHCSREVLYDITHCSYYFEPVDRGCGRMRRPIYAMDVSAEINFDYFSKVTGFSINKQLVSEYNNFINEHISQSPQTIDESVRVYCGDVCDQNIVYTYYKNSFGICMLEKHRKYFKDQGVFDFGEYFYWEKLDYSYKLSIW